ncbi:non-heme iron oxygenase ferredoxin subunit [Streptomyces sp. NPDC047043]|uniref:non-heme iron oxygenase ferredoxin subunit n=1 Tax=Streptomyces sp. NPDC047043 TaxID=3154497 RepID=UPI0033C73247
MAWLRACGPDDLQEGEALRIETLPPIALFRVGGEFFAIDDTCTHALSSLSEDGYLSGEEVECGFHFAKFCVRDGRALSLPASKPLTTFAVKIGDDGVHIDVGERPYRQMR